MRRVVLLVAIGTGCSSSDTSIAVEPQCNPLGTVACLAPWPSSAFEAEGRLALPDDGWPALDVAPWNEADGFSPAGPIIAVFAQALSAVALPPADNMGLSLAADSATVLLDLTTGTRVAHFAELGEATPEGQALLIWPAARLVPGHRYAVAITDRVTAADGTALEIPPGFAALRDGRGTDHPRLEAMRPRFDEALQLLDDAGATDLVLAWDFTVASEAYLGAALAAAQATAVPPRHTAITPPCARRAGHPQVLYLDDGSGDTPAALARSSCATAITAELPALAPPTDLRQVDAWANTLIATAADHAALVRALAPARVALVARREATLLAPAIAAAAGDLEAIALVDGSASNLALALRHAPAWRAAFPTAIDALFALALVQMRADRLDPGHAAAASQSLLVQLPALDDAAAWFARGLELAVARPSPAMPWGLRAATAPRAGLSIGASDARDQLRRFLATGVVQNERSP